MNETKLVIKTDICCQIKQFQLEIVEFLGQFLDIHYYRVIIHNLDKPGLLRLGCPDGGLQRELQLRQHLGYHKMASDLLLNLTLDSVDLGTQSPTPPSDLHLEPVLSEEIATVQEETEATDTEYLEEEYYPEVDPYQSQEKLLLLSEIPQESETLSTWLTQPHYEEECLLIASQICQFFRFVYQYQFCFINLLPQYIKVGTPLQFYDLTHGYPQGQQPQSGFVGEYYPPELACGNAITEQMSTYTVASFLYQAIHQQQPPTPESFAENSENLEIKKIPKIYQILTIGLTPYPENRFSLSQLLNLLVTTRKALATPRVTWQIAHNSTVGLSTHRLENEDSYGVIQTTGNELDSIMLAVVADGMGGLAQGEVASQMAVKTLTKAPIPHDLSTAARRSDWLNYLVETANEAITKNVNEGGTTISVVLAVKRDLNIAHVGDSRIYLIRNNLMCQLSEDHSMVAMLLANGQITYEESLHHSDRNILLKSLGSKPRLSQGYIQELNRFGSDLSLTLETGDIIILCSDGVWDLVSPGEFVDIFNQAIDLQQGVDQSIALVLEKGAHDNATVVAIKCSISQ